MLGGFLSGFQRRSAEHRQSAERAAEQERERTSRILTALAGSDDQEVSTLATTALLSGAAEGKSAKGLRGFFGEVERHPLFQTLTNLVNTPTTLRKALPQRDPPGATLGQPLTAHGDLPSRPIGPVTPGAATPAMGAPPPAPIAGLPGERIGELSHPAPRRLFLSAGERAHQEASGTIRGRFSGLVEGAEDVGARFTEDDLTSMARGMSGAPQRIIPRKSGTLKLSDGTTVGGSFDQEEGTFYDDNGVRRTDVVQFIPGNPNAGSGGSTTRYFTDASGVVRAYQGTQELGSLGKVGKPQQPPPVFSGLIQGDEGYTGVTRSGGTQPIPGVQPRSDPQQVANQLKQQGDQILRDAQSQTMRLGTLGYDPEELAANLEKAARAYGYPSYAAWQQAYAAAVQGVQQGRGRGRGAGAGAGVGQPPPTPGGAGGATPAPVNPRDPLGLLTGAGGRGGG
jgi:hypothetical protein